MPAADPHEHACLVYDDPAVFLSAAREFLAAGQRAGERVVLLAPPSLTAGLGLDGVEMEPVDEVYGAGAPVDPAELVRLFAERTAAAVDAGYTGFRAAAEATPLVRTPAQVDAFLRYEHLIDRHMAAHPTRGLCAFRRSELPDATLVRLASLHPRTDGASAPFRLYACPPSRGSAALAGELDLASHDMLPEMLDRAEVHPVGGALVFDVSELCFLDHRSMLALAEHARRRGHPAVLRSAPPGTARLIDLLGVDVRVEAVA